MPWILETLSSDYRIIPRLSWVTQSVGLGARVGPNLDRKDWV